MSLRILVPIDYSELSRTALETALSLHPDAEFTVLHVIDFRTSDLGPGGWGDSPGEFDEWLADAHGHADELLSDAEELADEYDTEIETETAVGEDSRRILQRVEDGEFDMIIMGSHGRSLPARILMGSVSETVVRRSPIPVLVVR